MLPQFDRFIVTGGAGFIGHRVSDLLVGAGKQVSVIDDLSVGMPMPVARDGLRPFEADIRDTDSLTRIFAEVKPEAVIHLAAVHHIPTCETRRDYALDVNVVGTERVLAACEAAGVGFVVLASSGAVYAPDEGVLLEDETPQRVIDNYSLGKISNEQQVHLWAGRCDGTARIARLFNTVGHDDPNGHLIPDILEQIEPGQSHATIRLGNTTTRRDYIHADDTASGIFALATQGRVAGPVEAFNISSGAEYSVGDIVTCIGELIGTEIGWETDETRFRRVDRPSLLGSIDKISGRTGWHPEIGFQDIIRKTLEGCDYPVTGA